MRVVGSTVFIGAGSGFAGDRGDAAGPVVKALAARAGFRCLMFETLAERTLALAHLQRRKDPDRGYSAALERMVGPVLAVCMGEGIKIVGNFGAANPAAAATSIAAMARAQKLKIPRIAIVEGDDVRSLLTTDQLAEREVGGAVLRGATEVIAANLYLGAGPLAQALDQGADIVVTGRVADSALALGPLIHAFGWRPDDWARLAAGTLVGHLLECGSQVTGGYFADPPAKDVPGLAEVGYPIAEVDADGIVIITKPCGTGGRVDRLTVIEQLLYEVHDPSTYIAPDVVLDLTQVSVEEVGRDRVRIVGARGGPAPETLKATVCIDGGVLGEAEISYAGRNAGMRARLAAQIIRDRMQARAPDLPIRIDAIGISSVLDHDQLGLDRAWPVQATDVRLRFAAQGRDAAHVMLLLDEVEALYCAGPAGGAGVRRSITPRLASASCLIERSFARPRVTMFEGGA